MLSTWLTFKVDYECRPTLADAEDDDDEDDDGDDAGTGPAGRIISLAGDRLNVFIMNR